MSARKVKVRIAEGHVAYVDGVAYLPGSVIEVNAADAKTMAERGEAEKV